MNRLKAFLKRIRLVYRPGDARTKKVLLCAIALSVTAVVALSLTVGSLQAQYEQDRQAAAALEEENSKLKDHINGLGSADSVEQIARDELGLVDPDTTVVVPGK